MTFNYKYASLPVLACEPASGSKHTHKKRAIADVHCPTRLSDSSSVRQSSDYAILTEEYATHLRPILRSTPANDTTHQPDDYASTPNTQPHSQFTVYVERLLAPDLKPPTADFSYLCALPPHIGVYLATIASPLILFALCLPSGSI